VRRYRQQGRRRHNRRDACFAASQQRRRLALLSAVAGRTPAERERVRQRLEIQKSEGISAITDAAQERWFAPEFLARRLEIVQRRMEQLQRIAPDSQSHTYCYRRHDMGCNPRMAEYTPTQFAGSRLKIMPGLRHSILLEAPALVSRLLLDFLAERVALRQD
jgi:(E)-2-((N-methylformamido)methylene)succinate hydrolase